MCSSGDSDAASEMVFIDAHVNHEGADPTQTPSPAQGRAVFFAKFPPTTTPEEVENLFAKFGSVESVNLYRKWATAKASKVTSLSSVICIAPANSGYDNWLIFA